MDGLLKQGNNWRLPVKGLKGGSPFSKSSSLKESQREAEPLLYNCIPFPLIRGRG
jgi:hypothetical protein